MGKQPTMRHVVYRAGLKVLNKDSLIKTVDNKSLKETHPIPINFKYFTYNIFFFKSLQRFKITKYNIGLPLDY